MSIAISINNQNLVQNKFKKFTCKEVTKRDKTCTSYLSLFFSVPQLAVVVFSMLPLLPVPLLKKLAKDNKKYNYFILKTNKQNKMTQEQNQY